MVEHKDVNPDVAKRILQKILVKENLNIKQKNKSAREMVKTIQDIIQEEVQSDSPAKRTTAHS